MTNLAATATRAMAFMANDCDASLYRSIFSRVRKAFIAALTVFVLAAFASFVSYKCFAINLVEQMAITADHATMTAEFATKVDCHYQAFDSRQGFASLDNRAKRAYSLLYQAAYLQRADITLNGFDGDELSSLMCVVWYDSPELFFVDPAVSVRTATTQTMTDHEVSTVRFTYLYEGEKLQEARLAYETGVNEIAQQFSAFRADANKVNAIQKWVINHVSYDDAAASHGAGMWQDSSVIANAVLDTDGYSLSEAATAYGALKDGKALCGGYSQLFCALCRNSGVECQTIIGSVDGYDAGHAWNAVCVEGCWRYIDVTWNDGSGDERAFYMASEGDFAASGHHAYKGNIPPLT